MYYVIGDLLLLILLHLIIRLDINMVLAATAAAAVFSLNSIKRYAFHISCELSTARSHNGKHENAWHPKRDNKNYLKLPLTQ